MPNVKAETIVKISSELLRAGGALPEHADIVANHLSDSNLVGHDSHGFIRILEYMDTIKRKDVNPTAVPKVVLDNKAIAKIDGNGTFGQVVFTHAQQLAVEKARQYGLGMVTMRNHSHTGRLGHYAEKVAENGMAAIMWTGFLNTQNKADSAPFGGYEARLGTNPIAMAFPREDGETVLLDFATTIAAEGKIRVFRAKGQKLPEKWVLDKQGRPSDLPDDFYDNGSILPLGGITGGHKGYALSFMAALFGGILAQLESSSPGVLPEKWYGSSILAIDLRNYAPVDAIYEQVAGAIQTVKSSPTVEGVKDILYPGEIESRVRRQRSKDGIEIDENTWNKVKEMLKEYKLEDKMKI